jgi:serine/threonine-protein kinase
MSGHTLASVLDLLREVPVLQADQLASMGGLLRQSRSPSALVRTLLKLGWLTAYQVKELFAGRGRGLLVGDFVTLEFLGEGSTSHVFKARPRSGGRHVVLKVLRGRILGGEAEEHVRREHLAGTRLEHPNILRCHGLGRSGDVNFLVLEYVKGRNLFSLVRECGALPVGRACDYARQTSLGLEHALRHGNLVHRDVKPSNLLLEAGTAVVKILDLGIACPAGPVPDCKPQRLGTPDYVAPEQVADPGRADPCSDIYALGCTLYHLLTGRPPFSGGSQEEKLLRHRCEQPPAVERLRPELPCGLGAVVRRMMAKLPNDRLPSAGAVADALAPFAEPGECDSRYILQVDDQGLAALDPAQPTEVLAGLPRAVGSDS